MKQPRIKVNPTTGQIVTWEPERTPEAPWFSIYAPDRNPGDAAQFLFTDEDVKDWPDWAPVTLDGPDESREFPAFARDVKAGHEIRLHGDWYKVTLAVNDIGMRERALYLDGESRPFVCYPGHALTVRQGA